MIQSSSFRMKSATSKVVTALDVSVVVLATFSGTISGLVGFKATKELNHRLGEVSCILEFFFSGVLELSNLLQANTVRKVWSASILAQV